MADPTPPEFLHARPGEVTADVARAFIGYYTKAGGCSNCGGIPHSATCFVARFEASLTPTPTTRPADRLRALLTDELLTRVLRLGFPDELFPELADANRECREHARAELLAALAPTLEAERDALAAENARMKGALESAVALIQGELGKDWADHYGADYEQITAALAQASQTQEHTT